MKNRTEKIITLAAAVLAGFGISVLSFFAFIFILFSAAQHILLPLLAVFYISILTFLVLWNIKKTKSIRFVLLIPGLCAAAGAVVIGYHDYIKKIPSVTENEFFSREYEPFAERNRLAKLNEESKLKITGNLPVLDGATALYPVYAAFAEAVYPKGEYGAFEGTVLWSRTGEAYRNLLTGKADIIFCAGPSEAQLKQFNSAGLKLKLIPIGKEAFVFFVNSKNPVSDLTIDAIGEIYSGKTKNWKSLNGKNQSIRAFQRPENSGSQTALEKIMGNKTIMKAKRENVANGMGGIINEIAVYRNFSNAIGYSFLFFATEMVKNDRIKLLSINSVYPSAETIRNGTYPFSDNFYAIYVEAEKKNEYIEPFIEWILSEQGQELISKTGYTPVKSE